MLFTAPQVGNRDRKVGQEATCAQPKREMPNTQSSRRMGAPTPEALRLGESAPPRWETEDSALAEGLGSFQCRACHPAAATSLCQITFHSSVHL